jgi:hypothetical protein
MNATAPVRIAAVDLLHWWKVLAKRDRKGSDWCRRKGIGKQRSVLTDAANVLPFGKISEGDRLLTEARAHHSATLAAICRECGRCPLA